MLALPALPHVLQKLTKAQKRREAKAREEAERDARIAAELEALGDSDRCVALGWRAAGNVQEHMCPSLL